MTPRLTDHEMRTVETGTECFSAILRSSESFNSGESNQSGSARESSRFDLDILVDPRGQYAWRRMPLESQYFFR